MGNYVSKTNFLTFCDVPLEIGPFDEHDYRWSQIEISKFIALFETFVLFHHYSAHIQSSNHDHV